MTLRTWQHPRFSIVRIIHPYNYYVYYFSPLIVNLNLFILLFLVRILCCYLIRIYSPSSFLSPSVSCPLLVTCFRRLIRFHLFSSLLFLLYPIVTLRPLCPHPNSHLILVLLLLSTSRFIPVSA